MTRTTPAPTIHSPSTPARVLVVPGFGATPEDHWFRWLVDDLAGHGISSRVVRLPDPDRPVAAEWESTVAQALGTPDDRTWIVAHSLGSITTLRVLAGRDAPWTLGGLVLVAGFTGALAGLPVLDEYLAGPLDLEQVVLRTGRRVVVRSDDDPVVPPAASDALAQRLEAQTVVRPGAGHFLGSDGATSLPVVRDLVLVGAAAAAPPV